MLRRISIFAFGLTAYTIFHATFLYMVAFIGGFFVPRTLDGAAQMATLPALAINAGLVLLFGLQHSVMARPAFKRRWTRIVPPETERSFYLLATCACLIVLFALWQPLGGQVWVVGNPIAAGALWAVFALGWGLVLLSTFLINHFDLFGLRQSWAAFRGREPEPLKFVQPWIYRVVRHPLYVGWLLIVWATPVMTVAHLVFALLATAYILIGIQLEERDLADAHPEYKDYKKRVPALVPSLRRVFRRAGSSTLAEARR